VKNNENKTPLYFAIHHQKHDICYLILSKIDINNLSNSHIYLHKAIRMRDPILTKKFLESGIDVNAPDDQGKSYFDNLI